MDQLLSDSTQRMQKTIHSFSEDLKKVRTGRAHVSMLDSVRVNYYGTMTPLSQVASLSCPDPKSFLVSPWESNLLKEVETSIVKSDIGMTPMNDGKVIRLKLPDLTEERRKDLVKTTKKMAEDARVGIRMIRREANETLKKSLKSKEIDEDSQKNLLDKIQKVTDQNIAEIDRICDEKEKDIMTI